MFMQVAKLTGCNVISVVKRDSQVRGRCALGADSVVQITQGERSGEGGAQTDVRRAAAATW